MKVVLWTIGVGTGGFFALSIVTGCAGTNPAPIPADPVARFHHEDQLPISVSWSDLVLSSLEPPGAAPHRGDTGAWGSDSWEIHSDRHRSIGFGILGVPNLRLELVGSNGRVAASVRSGEVDRTVQLAPGRYRVVVVNEGVDHRYIQVGWHASDGRDTFRAGLYASLSLGPAVNRVVSLRPLLGAIYKATPSDFASKGTGQGSPYEDSDFTCEDFRASWGPTGRNDIAKLRAAGVNFLHFYDWNDPGFTSGPNNFDRHHRNFLQHCANNGMTFAVPISNYAIRNNRSDIIQAIVNEVYTSSKPLAGLIMWQVGNEYDGNGFSASQIVQAARKIAEIEDQLGVLESDRPAMTSPVTFGLNGNPVEGLQKTLELRNAFDAAGLSQLWKSRWVASVNSFNPGSDLARWIPQFQQAVGIPFCLFEMGKEIGGVVDGVYSPDYGDVHNEGQQGTFYQQQLAAVIPFAKDSNSLYVGQCVFAFVNEAHKGGTEATFGVYAINQNGGLGQGRFAKNGWTYPLDSYREKPSFTAMKNAYLGAR